MFWKIEREGKYLATIDVSSVKNTEVDQVTAIIGDSINIDSVLSIAEGIIDMVLDSCVDSFECRLGFKKYKKDRLKITLSQEDWTEEDWDFFKYDIALALVAVVRNDKLRIYKTKIAKHLLDDVLQMERYILEESGQPEAHAISKTNPSISEQKSEPATKSVGALDNFMNMPV